MIGRPPPRVRDAGWLGLCLLAAITGVSGVTGCDEDECPALRAELRAHYEPYGDACTDGAQCPSGACDVGRTSGVCRCEADDECRSGLCLDGLCANPQHDRRLTPGLAERGGGARVQPLCPGTDRAARRASTECAAVLQFLEKATCASCDEASLRLCGCRSGGALHACLVRAADAESTPEDDQQERLCEAEAARVDCRDHLGPAGSACGDASTGAAECQSGLCRDADPTNNAGVRGHRPDDWRCVDGCASDSDCPAGSICDAAAPLSEAPTGIPHTCRTRP